MNFDLGIEEGGTKDQVKPHFSLSVINCQLSNECYCKLLQFLVLLLNLSFILHSWFHNRK